MRFLILAALGAILAACATARPVTPTPNAATPTAPTPSRLAILLGSAGQNDAPTIADIERLAGAPDIRRQDGAGAALTYRLESCALMLLFVADGRNELRLAQAHPGPRRTGAEAPSLDQCAAEASARQQ